MSESLAAARPVPVGSWLGALWRKRRADAPMAVASDLESLVRALQQGDDRALEAFIEATQEGAYRVAFSILGQRERCQDVLQETYLTVYQKIGQLQTPAALKGWFNQILVNRCRQELRGRKGDQSLDQLLETAPGPSVDGMAHGVEQKLDVREALGTLAPDDREVLALREVCELSYQEISENLGIPLGTVRSRIFNSRQRLLAVLRPHASAASLKRRPR